MKVRILYPHEDDAGIRITPADIEDSEDRHPLDFADDAEGQEVTVIVRWPGIAAGKIAAVGAGAAVGLLAYGSMVVAILFLRLIRAVIGGVCEHSGRGAKHTR